MGLQQSKEESLYKQVNHGDIEGIKALHSQGAGLEWTDREGKTPLIAACMTPELNNVAKTLIELGANFNAYSRGRFGGTPLHHAAKRGLEQTVKLLLANGANALVTNDDGQTPLDVARVRAYGNIVRAIESHLCLFSGWLRELYGPSFLELLAPQFLSRKVWVVVLPCGSRIPTKPFKLELAIYNNFQDAKLRTLIPLWKANMEEPKFNQPDPTVIISDNSTIPRHWRRKRGILSSREARCKSRGVRHTRIKLAAASENDKQQLQRFCNACKGIPQVMHTAFPFNTQAPVVPTTAPPNAEDVEYLMAINASLQSYMQERPPHLDTHPISGANVSTSGTKSVDITTHSGGNVMGAFAPKGSSSEWEIKGVGSSSKPAQYVHTESGIAAVHTMPKSPMPASIPSAPPVADAVLDDGPIHCPTIDSNSVDLSSLTLDTSPVRADEKMEDTCTSSSCVICLDAPVEGACIPCGHMAGCMSCLNEIKEKRWGCPVCRAKIDQVIRLYAV
ncbi:unnamed protein product [Ilex paraguariensis]|uniref:RING-type domain-containing protein n=1 Tax=Ilex paraguariensis TaxID=185542 RepID=A0ABC8TG17_9AQUA